MAALERARAVAGAVRDPEVPVLTIADLGVLRDVRIADDGAVEVTVTPTYSGCPAMDTIRSDVDHALREAGFGDVRVRTVLAPAWTTDWMTAEARDKLRAYGIAPPTGNCGSAEPDPNAGTKQKVIRFVPRSLPAPACPRCGSKHTERLAQFGSTACKALYRCVDCREPFDYFKPY